MCVGALDHASFRRAVFIQTDLRNASLRFAVHTDATLFVSNLARTFLGDATLVRSRLFFVDIRGAFLSDAELHGAEISLSNVSGADFSKADLGDVRFGGLCYDETTRWPESFSPPTGRRVQGLGRV